MALKDTICVSGIPVTCGTQAHHLSAAAPYPVPRIDAPVVARLVEAGAWIQGTAVCENYCVSLASFTSATGPVENAWLPGFSAGGSSSGCAALVALNTVKAWRQRKGLPYEHLADGVDLAIGGDQAGSIRVVCPGLGRLSALRPCRRSWWPIADANSPSPPPSAVSMA